MKTYINESQATQYNRLSAMADLIDQQIQALAVAIVQAGIPDEDKVGALNYLSRADGIKGLSYALHPQSEWQGGESWKLVRPGIACISKPV